MDRLIAAMENWAQGTRLEKRAAAAALCEPRLLRHLPHALAVLAVLDSITASIPPVNERKSDEFQALKKGLGYCWSVAVVAAPEQGKRLMERWLGSGDKDIRWIMKENLKKNRLVKMDAGWVEANIPRLEEQA